MARTAEMPLRAIDTGRIPELEGLRAVLAWTVVAAHVLMAYGWAAWAAGSFSFVFNAAEAAVDVFMLLSGFVITRLILVEKEPFGRFIWRRSCRIVPAYWVALTFAVLLNSKVARNLSHLPVTPEREASLLVCHLGASRFWTDLPLHIALLHGLAPFKWLPLAPFTFLGVAWSLSLEWQFYWVAPLALLLALRNSLAAAIIVMMTVVACFFVNDISQVFSDAFLPVKAPFFVIGAITYFAVAGAHRSRNSGLAIAMGAAVIALWWWNSRNRGIEGLTAFGGWLLVVSTVRYGTCGPMSRFLNSAVMQHLGRISYSTYLFHVPVLTIVEAGVWSWLHVTAPWQLALWTGVPGALGTLAVSELSWRVVERPFQRIGRVTASVLAEGIGTSS